MKKLRIFVIVISLVVVAYFIGADKYYAYKLVGTDTSPDGRYTLDIYVASRMDVVSEYIIPHFSSQWPYYNAYPVLKNHSGKILYKPSLLCRNKAIYGDVNINWDMEDKKVYYTKFDYIKLK